LCFPCVTHSNLLHIVNMCVLYKHKLCFLHLYLLFCGQFLTVLKFSEVTLYVYLVFTLKAHSFARLFRAIRHNPLTHVAGATAQPAIIVPAKCQDFATLSSLVTITSCWLAVTRESHVKDEVTNCDFSLPLCRSLSADCGQLLNVLTVVAY